MISGESVGSSRDRGIFLETSAQIYRLLGSREMERGIRELCGKFTCIATSKFVLEEFRVVVGGLYLAVSDSIGRIVAQAKPRTFAQIWSEAADLLPFYVSGGPKLLSQLIAGLGGRYGERDVSPIEVVNFLSGQRANLMELVSCGFAPKSPMRVFDSSSCCVWSAGSHLCETEPGERCKLKEICIGRRQIFFDVVGTIAASGREEGRWLKGHLEELLALGEVELLRAVGKHPGPFGDIIIFFEVPDEWAILTRDRTFKIISEHHGCNIEVYHVRLPRLASGQRCSVWTEAAGGVWVEATLVNWTSLDACIFSRSRLGPKASEVVVSASELENERRGRIMRVEHRSDGFIYGIRFLKNR